MRLYNAIYYGQALGVFIKYENGMLRLAFNLGKSKSIGREADLKISEPLILYDSALSISDEERLPIVNILAKFVDISNTSPLRSEERRINVKLTRNYNLDPEKEQLVSEITSLALWVGVVDGPPGIGKAIFIAIATSEIAESGGTVLINSHTNISVDNALERIVKINPNISGRIIHVSHPVKVSKTIRSFLDDLRENERRYEWFERIVDEKRTIGMTIAKLAV